MKSAQILTRRSPLVSKQENYKIKPANKPHLQMRAFPPRKAHLKSKPAHGQANYPQQDTWPRSPSSHNRAVRKVAEKINSPLILRSDLTSKKTMPVDRKMQRCRLPGGVNWLGSKDMWEEGSAVV